MSRFTEGADRRVSLKHAQEAWAQVTRFRRELEDRRKRRLAAFGIADALDLCDEIPIPGALDKVNDAGWYSATIEGAVYKAHVANGKCIEVVNEGERRSVVRNPLDSE